MGRARIAVVDYGCKRSILRRLAGAGAAVTVFPHDVDADELAAHDGVLLSNGPGDPEPLVEETRVVRDLLGRVPVLGICLGHQLLGLAPGHGRRSSPSATAGRTIRCSSAHGRVLVTSQNHGFAVDASEAPEATHVSLYDGTVEGSSFPSCARGPCSSIPRPGPGRTTPGRSSSGGSRRCAVAA